MKTRPEYIPLLCFILFLFTGFSPVPNWAKTNKKPKATTTTDTYFYQYHYNKERLPKLLDISDSVALLSWIRFHTQRGRVYGSLVFSRELINTFQNQLSAEPLRSIQHEYIVPHSTGLWSLHLNGSLRKRESIHIVKDRLVRTSRRSKSVPETEQKKTNWPQLSETFDQCGKTLGQFFHVILNCRGGKYGRASKHSMSYVFFQRIPGSTVVIGDLVTGVDQVGNVIRLLYDQNLKMMSLAYNKLSENHRLYFVHFAGKGTREHLTTSIHKLVETSVRSSKEPVSYSNAD